MLKRAASRFAKTTIFGWSGTVWEQLDQTGALEPYSRGTSSDSTEKMRVVLTNPDNAIDPLYTALRFGSEEAPIYLRGRTLVDTHLYDYLNATVLMLAELVAVVQSFAKSTAASGVPMLPTRTTSATYFCSREYSSSIGDHDEPTIKFSSTMIWLPSDAKINTDMEIQLGLDYYEIESVANTHGLVGCKCVTKRNPIPHG